MDSNNSRKNILVAPLNWGLGHATRCIPIICELEKNGFNPIIASDGIALDLLKKEFPHLTSLELPSYNIHYSKRSANLKWKLIKNSPRITKAIVTEKRMVKNWITQYNLTGIISDNRLGVRNKKVKSVFITHQLNLLSGKTTWISTKLHQYFISKFDQCWIPDLKNFPNYSGVLGHLKKVNPKKLNLKYIGILSRFEKKELPKKYDLMVILSGPEPQRTILEEKIIYELPNYIGKVVFIKGKVEFEQKKEQINQVLYYNFMQSEELEKTFNESEIVLCRSGYTTIMDLAKLQKKAFFIPTPGQYEQEYLAKKHKRTGLISYCKQNSFVIEKLKEVNQYKGFSNINSNIDWKELFQFF
jgi:predicted glycosyltransferase